MYVVSNYLFCFFKQKTAYEMRISDWSSDVCSSDLKRQKACRPCAELSRLQKLPHQIEAKRAYHRDYGRQLRRKRGDRKFKGEVIRCARCGIDVVTKGIGQKYCEPCYPDAAKERDRRHDRQRHIRN